MNAIPKPLPPDPDAVADAYDLGRSLGLPTPAARGELGRVWRLETSRGAWAVKELFRPGSEAEARADVAFQDAALRAGIPMPRPVAARGGSILARVDRIDGGARRPGRVLGTSHMPAGSGGIGRLGEPGRSCAPGTTSPVTGHATVRVYTWVELAGRHVAPSLRDVAGILGRLHGLSFPDRGPVDPWFTEPVDRSRWEWLLAEARRRGASWAGALARLVPVILDGDEAISGGRHEPTIRCHLDLNPENVLVDVSGHPVVVDWENSGPAAAEQELASVVAEFVADPRDLPAFQQAYAAVGGSATLRDHTSFAMTLATQANLVAWYAGHALDPASTPEDRDRSTHWIEEIAAHAFTLARIDAWLAAAGGPAGDADPLAPRSPRNLGRPRTVTGT